VKRLAIIAGIGHTDRLRFRAAGVAGFNPARAYQDDDVRPHHTNVDRSGRVREQDLKHNAGVMAWFAGQAATTAERKPRA
jgi:carboxypeptidase Q